MEENFSTPAVLGKLLAGAFLYEETFGEGDGAATLQKAVAKARKWLGEETAKQLIESTKDEHTALLYACIDKAVIGQISNETKELLGKLTPASKVFIEALYLSLTGQNPAQKEGAPQRWAPLVWKLKKVADRYLDLSPSKVSQQDLAKAVKEIVLPLVETLREYTLKLV